jgi:TatD DNase family protein
MIFAFQLSKHSNPLFMVPFIDIHTHRTPTSKSIIQVQNVIFPNEAVVTTTCSVGLHPWYIPEENITSHLNCLGQLLSQSNIWGLGECGLDKVCTKDWKLQVYAFREQVLLANRFNKPLIIHCVKAYEEVLKILSETKNKVPTIFHGFNKHQQLADSLIKKGYYLSFGKDLNNQKLQETFKNCPLDQVFLETDQSDFTIEEIYTLALKGRKMELNTAKNQIFCNFKNCNIAF